MDANNISFENLPNAVAHLVSELGEIKSLVEKGQTPVVQQKRIPIDIEEACWIIGKARPTVYALVRKRFYEKSPHLRYASSSISRKSVALFILSIDEVFTKCKREKISRRIVCIYHEGILCKTFFFYFVDLLLIFICIFEVMFISL